LTLDSPAGRIEAQVHPGGEVSVNRGPVRFDPAALPFEASSEADAYPLEVDGETVQIGAVSIGNPHAVLTVASAETAPVERLGPAIEHHPRFPNRVNVGFMEVRDRTHVRLRVYERGVGETLACGTGACAALAVGRRWGLLDPEVRISARGGELGVRWGGPGEPIWLTGPAQFAFQGHIDL
jgi:diaminopimelate epimerase